MTLAWTLFLLYMGATSWLAWVGYRRTRDFSSFAIGTGDLSPFTVGITLAASTASAATFIINPGFIYVDGLSAWIHMVPGTGLGFCTMLFILSFRFRRIGAEAGSLTIPDWIGDRYGSKGFALWFAVINLLAFAFVVLLVGGIAIVLQALLGISNLAAITLVLVFVTGYVFVGGTYAHVFTNVLQGTLMIGVSILILGTGVSLFFSEPGLFAALREIDPSLLAPVKRDGALFNDVFSIYVAGFMVGATVVAQPHILTKALYVKTDRAVKQYLWIFTGAFSLFLLLGTVGLFAHLTLQPEQLVDAATGAFRQDLVMTVYLENALPGWLFTVVSVVLVAAAMSTLDGVLVGVSTITANDLIVNLIDRFGDGGMTPEERDRFAYRASHVVLVALAGLTFLVVRDPPELLGIFGQVGVYGMAIAAVPPLLAGVLFRTPRIAIVWTASAVGLALHFGLFFLGDRLFPASSLTFANPGVTLSIAVLASALPALLISWWIDLRDAGAAR